MSRISFLQSFDDGRHARAKRAFDHDGIAGTDRAISYEEIAKLPNAKPEKLKAIESFTPFQGLLALTANVHQRTDLVRRATFPVPVHRLCIRVRLQQCRHERQGVDPVER